MLRRRMLNAYLSRIGQAEFDKDGLLSGYPILEAADVDALPDIDIWTFANAIDQLASRAPVAFPFRCGMDFRPQEFGLVGFAMVAAPDIGTAAETWARYGQLTQLPFSSVMHVTRSQWEITYCLNVPLTPRAVAFVAGSILGSMVALSSKLSGERVIMEHIELPSACAAHLPWYEKLGIARFTANSPSFRFRGPRDALAIPVLSADAKLHEIMMRECEKALAARRAETPLQEQVMKLLCGRLGSIPSLENIAALANMSKRSFQRALEKEKISYQQLLMDFRVNYIRLLAADNSISTKQVSHLLDYEDSSSIYRLLKRHRVESEQELPSVSAGR